MQSAPMVYFNSASKRFVLITLSLSSIQIWFTIYLYIYIYMLLSGNVASLCCVCVCVVYCSVSFIFMWGVFASVSVGCSPIRALGCLKIYQFKKKKL